MRGDWKFPMWPLYKKVQETPGTVTVTKLSYFQNVKVIYCHHDKNMCYSLPIFKYFICLFVWITCVLTYSDVFGV